MARACWRLTAASWLRPLPYWACAQAIEQFRRGTLPLQGRGQARHGVVIAPQGHVIQPGPIQDLLRLLAGGVGFHEALHALQGPLRLPQAAIDGRRFADHLPVLGVIPGSPMEIGQGLEIDRPGSIALAGGQEAIALASQHPTADPPRGSQLGIPAQHLVDVLCRVVQAAHLQVHLGQPDPQVGIGAKTACLFQLGHGFGPGVAQPEHFGIVAAGFAVGGTGLDRLGQLRFGLLRLLPLQKRVAFAGQIPRGLQRCRNGIAQPGPMAPRCRSQARCQQ